MANHSVQNQTNSTSYDFGSGIEDYSIIDSRYFSQVASIEDEKKVSSTYLSFKRFCDVSLSLCGILLTSPILLLTSLIIKCTSRGPVIFKDRRLGLGGKEFNVYKFRTMYLDAESNIDNYLTGAEKRIWNIERKFDNDPRITKIGKILRKSSLDELPQLFNILVGNMSFVGPRPITKNEIDSHFTYHEQDMLFSCKPGLTGYWQVYGRSNVDFASGERQKLELKYYNKRSFLLDVKLFLLTIPSVIMQKGAK